MSEAQEPEEIQEPVAAESAEGIVGRAKDDMVRYMVNVRGGQDFVIEVPAGWKLTFGYVNPAGSKDAYNRGDGHCLRVWEGEKLRAVYGDVTGFRDLAIPLARKLVKETGSASWSRDSSGAFEHEAKGQREESFLQIEAPEFS
jgi:hypothetical protein